MIAKPTTYSGDVLGASTAPTDTVSHAELTAAVEQLRSTLSLQFLTITSSGPSFSGSAASTPVSFQTFAASQRIDQLSNVTISNATLQGVAGLTAGDIPALNYLSISGGTLTGSIAIPSLTTTSSTATSTFAGPIATPNPVDVFDDFSGPPNGALDGRMPTTGTYAWVAGGAGYLGAYAGNGILGTTGGNTYFVIQSSHTPWEVTTTFTSTTGTPSAVISVVKDHPGHGFSAMWHVNFNSPAGHIGTGYWNDTWNGSASTVSGVGATFEYQASDCPTLAQGTFYRARLVINAPYSDASIETLDGTVLCTQHSYDPLLSTLIGPYTYIQSSDSGQIYSSFNVNDRPTSANLLYGKSVSGLDATPIGMLTRAAANFSSLNVGNGAPSGVFSVSWDGTVSTTPAILSAGTGNLIVGSTVSGNIAKLTLKNGAGGTGVITMDGSYALSLAGNSGTAFLTKPANSAVPYFASGLGIASSSPWKTLSVVGTVAINGLTGAVGAGSLCLSANKEVVYNSGTDNCLSSLRATKHDINNLTLSGIDAVTALKSVSFIYNDDASSTVRYGFIAEDTATVDPHFATYDAVGNVSGVDDRSLISILVKAVQEILATIGGFANSFTTKQLCVADDTGETCVSRGQLQALLRNQLSVQITEPSPVISGTSTPDTEPPVILVNGNNPAEVNVGDAYNDLGATVTDNVDTNLGIHTFVGSTPFEQADIDTSAPATYHISYVSTDASGNAATSTRTVIVLAASSTAMQ